MKIRQYLLGAILVFMSLSLLPSKAKADHCAGGELIYEWISDSTYRFIFKFYRDCTGIDAYATQDLCMYSSCVPGTSSITMQKYTGTFPDGRSNGDPVAAGCSGYPTVCETTGSPIPGYREWWYTALVTMPYQCSYWRFGISVSARNFSNNIPGGYLYLETEFNNKLFQGNSSPYFSVPPVPYFCINKPTTYNNGAIDPDGDSLVTDILQPRSGALCDGSAANLAWKTPASPPYGLPNNPFQTNNTFSVNASTGNMSFTPGQLGPGTITVRTKEYRKGILVGSIMRDVQIQVLACSAVAPSVDPISSTILGGAYTNNRVNGCAGTPLKFGFLIKGAASDNILIGTDNHIFSFPSAAITYSHQKSDSVRGDFAWTPSATDTGLRTLLITVKDSTCKPPGILVYQVFTLPVYIWPATKAVPDTSICPTQSAFLSVNGGGAFQWTVAPGGGSISTLSCTSCTSPVVTPPVKTTYIVTSTANAYCGNTSDSVVVDVLPGLNFRPLKDTVTCLNNSVVLDLKTAPPAGAKYIVAWKPGTFLDDSTKSAVTATPSLVPQNGYIDYSVIITSTVNKCRAFDTVRLNVLSGFKLDNPDTAICNGQVVQVRASADPRYTIKWTDDSAGVGIFSNDASTTPTIIPAKTGPDRYIMTLSFVNASGAHICRDTSADFDIDMQPIPFVTVDNDASMCEGDTMQLNGVVTPAGYPFDLTWAPGSALNNPKIATPIFTAHQNTKLTLTAKTKEAGCSASDDINITVFPAAFLFASNDTAICPGESAQLHVTGNGVKTFRWIPDIRISSPYSWDPVVTPPATQTYRVYAVDTNFCSDTQAVVVTVHPKAMIDLPDSVRLYPGDSYKMQPGGNCSYFSWYPPLGLNRANISNPIAQPEVNTRYFVTGITEAGCSTSDSVSVLVSYESIVDVPNAFIPGSGDNGKFRVVHLGSATLKNFSIYNRWGVKVFETADINDGWDGTYKGEAQPIGVYVYSVEAVTPGGRKFTKQGNVTLVR